MSAARFGYKVLHIQAEGTAQECMLGYDATWTALLKRDLRTMAADATMADFVKSLGITKDIFDLSEQIDTHITHLTLLHNLYKNYLYDFLVHFHNLIYLIDPVIFLN